MFMGGDSCSERGGFESQHCILDGLFSHLFDVKFVMLFEKMKIFEKEAGDGPFLKRNERTPSASNLVATNHVAEDIKL